jgi:hypothetical protein
LTEAPNCFLGHAETRRRQVVHTPAEQAAGGLGRRWASSWSVPWRRLAKPACAAVAQQSGQAKPRAPSTPQSRARSVLVLGSRPAPVGVSDRSGQPNRCGGRSPADGLARRSEER